MFYAEMVPKETAVVDDSTDRGIVANTARRVLSKVEVGVCSSYAL